MEGNLETDGYLLIRGVIPESNVKEAQAAITKTHVNYNVIDKYIKDSMFGTINKLFNWSAVNNKYRVSNNNNSTDASTFHRDIICQDIYYTNKNEWKLNPSMTVLSYLDTTVMEIIPGSHLHPVIEWSDMISTYNKKQKMTLHPGDILLFYSTTLHRGIFSENLENRRLIQVFETFKTQAEYQRYSNDIYHVKSSEKYEAYGDMMIWLSKQEMTIFIFNQMGYLNAAKGYGHITNTMPYLSSEGTRGRLELDFTQEWQPINKYVFHEKKSELPDEYVSAFNWYCYNLFFITTFILLCSIIFLIVYVIYKIYKSNKTNIVNMVNSANKTIKNKTVRRLSTRRA